MLLDSTTLLTRRHSCTDARDGAWEFAYPVACVGGAEELEPDDVLLYRHGVAPAAALTVTSGDSGGEGTSSGVRAPASDVPSAAELGGSGAVVGASAAELGGSGAVVGASAAELGGSGAVVGARMVVVTYGNGMPHALKAIQQSGLACHVIDCPLLSMPRGTPAIAPCARLRCSHACRRLPGGRRAAASPGLAPASGRRPTEQVDTAECLANM